MIESACVDDISTVVPSDNKNNNNNNVKNKWYLMIFCNIFSSVVNKLFSFVNLGLLRTSWKGRN